MIVLFVLPLIAICVYAGSCIFYPITACGRCSGAGKHRNLTGRAWRNCRRCQGSGARIRTGRRIYNHIRRLQKARS